ncbi:LppU/SCO3897 family protein [Fodinicola feengrottensis]|uniref:LppU/SCO3897 family protein n=1 Tax=Fodinicola feengrottensis TaxID=435914 RepID=UPI0013D451EF|nr:hypothetical protein [Fodinicola feengrottensis]
MGGGAIAGIIIGGGILLLLCGGGVGAGITYFATGSNNRSTSGGSGGNTSRQMPSGRPTGSAANSSVPVSIRDLKVGQCMKFGSDVESQPEYQEGAPVQCSEPNSWRVIQRLDGTTDSTPCKSANGFGSYASSDDVPVKYVLCVEANDH